MSSRPWVRIPPALYELEDRPVDGRVEEVTEQGLGRARALTCSWADKPPGPTGEGVAASQRRWQDCREVQQLAPGPSDGNVSAPGCGEPIPPSISPGGRDVTASIRGRDPRSVGSSPTGRLAFFPQGWIPQERNQPGGILADAEHRRAQRAVTASPMAVVVRLHPSALQSTARKEACRICVVHIDLGPARGHPPPRPWSRPRQDRAVSRVARGGPRAAAGAADACRRDALRPGRPPPHHRRPRRGSRADRGGGSRLRRTTTAGAARPPLPHERSPPIAQHGGRMGP